MKRETAAMRRESGESTYPAIAPCGVRSANVAHGYTEHAELVHILKGHPEQRGERVPSVWMAKVLRLGWDPGRTKDAIAEWYFAWRCVDETLERQLALL